MSRWRVFWECLRQAKCSAKHDAVALQLTSRPFTSETIFPTVTSRENEEAKSQQKQNPSFALLTEVFDKLLKSSDGKHLRAPKNLKSLKDPAARVVCNRLLKSCSRNRDSKMAKEIWGFMRSNQIRMNKVSHGCLLSALSRGGCIEEAVELLKLLAKTDEANVVLFNIVLNGCVHTQNKVYAERCVQLMDEQGIKKDECTYMELIKLSGGYRDLSAIQTWWRLFNENGTPSRRACSDYVVALCRVSEFTSARQTLKEIVSSCALELIKHLDSVEGKALVKASHSSRADKLDTAQGSLSTSEIVDRELDGILSEPHSSAVLDTVELSEENFAAHELDLDEEVEPTDDRSRSLQENEYEALLFSREDIAVPGYPHELLSKGVKVSDLNFVGFVDLENAYNSMIDAAGKAKNHVLAEALFSEMRQLGLKCDVYTYNALLRAVLDGRGAQHGIWILRRMESSGTKPDVYSLTALMEAYCRERSFNKAYAVLDYMESGSQNQHPSCHTYNIFLNACVTWDNTKRALQVFGRMKRFGVAPDICTYIALFKILGNTGTDPESTNSWSREQIAKRVAAIELDMSYSGVRHTPESYTCLMLGEHGLTEMMVNTLQDASARGGDLLDITSYNAAIQACVNQNQVETAWSLHDDMQKAGVKPDVYTYNILINSCTHDNKLATAFELVDTMRQQGLTADVVTFNTLLKVICRSGKMDIVFDFLKEMTSSGVQPDTVTFNTVLTSASYYKRMDVLEYILEEMRRRKISPDQHTFLPVVTAYMEAGQSDDAVEALRVLSFRMLDDCDPADAVDGEGVREREALGDVTRRKLAFGLSSRNHLKDAVLQTSPKAFALHAGSLAGLVLGDSEDLYVDESRWAARLSAQYDQLSLLHDWNA